MISIKLFQGSSYQVTLLPLSPDQPTTTPGVPVGQSGGNLEEHLVGEAGGYLPSSKMHPAGNSFGFSFSLYHHSIQNKLIILTSPITKVTVLQIAYI
ncbi:hypothetical protein EYC84_011417 [Monilinia fructicola]|uniref:Uncharacterized protein n=1 Tax=Monilinia fructicola TaxID=38448 RepID=A0A5M9JB03_MONFR|nr:hypothetical protein EYC84_011417 [Monilinia fructicola]